MDFYTAKKRLKITLFVVAVLIGIGSLMYSERLIDKLKTEEQKKIQLWAEAVKEMQTIPIDGSVSPTLYKIIEENKTIPVILCDSSNNIITHMNLSLSETKNEASLKRTLENMKNEYNVIEIIFDAGKKNYVYYKDSSLLVLLSSYPYIQLGLISLFIFVSYIAFSNSRKAEENQIWAGISKETAHQLGTPLSSLLAWIEYLKLKNSNPEMIAEVQKDVSRLELITERFSKIGSTPELTQTPITPIIEETVEYLKKRTSSQVIYKIKNEITPETTAKLNKPLFAWVIENLCKNAVDAMESKGNIDIEISKKKDTIHIDVSDTGKGISKNNLKSVFKAGFTTKKRGWGLGLSLAKRIMEQYHAGKIYVKQSIQGQGTTFRIEIFNNPHKKQTCFIKRNLQRMKQKLIRTS